MAGLLALILAFSFYLYTPNTRTNTEIEINGTTLDTIYSNFMGTNMTYSKEDANTLLTKANNILVNYQDSTLVSEELNTMINEINEVIWGFNDYVRRSSSPSDFTLNQAFIENDRQLIINKTNSLRSVYLSYAYSNDPIILVKNKAHTKIIGQINYVLEVMQMTAATYDSYNIMKNKLLELNTSTSSNAFELSCTQYIDEIIDIILPAEYITTLTDNYLDTASLRLDEIELNVESFMDEFARIGTSEYQASTEKKSDLNALVSQYYNTCMQSYDIVISNIKLKISDSYTESEFKGFYGFDDFNRYEAQQTLTKQQFLFDNNKLDYDYANTFSFAYTSNFEPNAFDFMYFVLELFSFIIIIYCVVLGSSMIAGEQANGTLKLLAIRPYRRSKILASKILATMFFVFVFVLFSSLIALIAGGTLYGFNSLPILTIFNSTTAIILAPLTVFAIYLCSLLLKIFVFIALAFAISTIFKSYVGAVCVSMLCFFGTSILNLFFTNSPIFKFLPLNNIDLFKYFGGGAFASNSNASLVNVFTSPILADTSFAFSITNILLTLTVILVTTFIVFKRRDIA